MRFFTWLDSLILAVLPVRFHRYTKIVRYIISGGTAAVVDILFLYIFKSVFHIWYLLSAILAFILAFMVSFTLQKLWTFADTSDKWQSQALIYFIITSLNLGVNTLLMYIFVDFLNIHYIAAQIIAGALVAIESYFVYQIFVFRKTPQI
jgi:putative flippase GtrA